MTIERGRSLLDSFGQLQWRPECGIGWYPVSAQPYDLHYWEKYVGLDSSPIGERLTWCRLDLVQKFHAGSVVDIGIGGGKFVRSHPCASGYDINPAAIAWLTKIGKFVDPFSSVVEAATFWDSLEHIHDPSQLLRNVRRFCFVSLPIFSDCEHVLRSKHFKPDEHCWYFTRRGFETFMRFFGFQVIHECTMEQDAGREDIETFVFERK